MFIFLEYVRSYRERLNDICKGKSEINKNIIYISGCVL